MNEVLIPILFGWDDVNIGYMEQNIVGHMSTFFVCILFISKLHGYATEITQRYDHEQLTSNLMK